MDPVEHDSAEIIDQTELYPATNVPVEVCGPVQTRALPVRNSSLRGVTLGTAAAVKIASHDPRRKALRVVALDPSGSCTAVALGNSKNEAEGAYAFLLPLVQAVAAAPAASRILSLDSISEVWAVAVAKTCTLSVVSESWI